jgi:hypothetical protein
MKLGLRMCHLVVADLRRQKSRTGAWPTLRWCSNTQLQQLLQRLQLVDLAWETPVVLPVKR